MAYFTIQQGCFFLCSDIPSEQKHKLNDLLLIEALRKGINTKKGLPQNGRFCNSPSFSEAAPTRAAVSGCHGPKTPLLCWRLISVVHVQTASFVLKSVSVSANR